MSANAQPIFTINDFPTEIVERFAPDLRPRTVSNLRLVSPRFRDVFTSDRYYRSYLWHGKREEFYREDLEEIGEARDRWRRCLEVEKRRLDNWRQGRPTRVETVQIPSNERRSCLAGWRGTVGAGNNFLIMCQLDNRKILLANVTKNQIMTVVDVSSYTQQRYYFAHLLADQVVIDDHNGLKQVFSILYEEGKHALKRVFTIETTAVHEFYISGFSGSTQSYRNFYVNHSEVGILRVWDLKRGGLPDNLVLKDLLPPNHASKLGEFYRVDVLKTEFPYVLVEICNRRARNFLYLAVNVEEKRVACCVACEADKRMLKWLVKGRELFMELCNKEGSERDIRIYGLRPRSQPCSEPQLLFRKTLQNQTYHPHFEPPWLIQCKLCPDNELIVTHVDETSTQILSQTHPYAINMSLYAAVGPFFIVKSLRSYRGLGIMSMYRQCRLVTLDKAGEPLFEWSEMLAANGADFEGDKVNCDIPPLFHSLSKWVLQNLDGNILYICHF